MYCPQCGKEIGTESQFCPFCGKPVSAGETPGAAGTEEPAQQPPAPPSQAPQPPAGGYVPPAPQAPPPPGVAPPPPGAGPGMQPTGYAQPDKKSALPWILGILGVAAIAAVTLVLVFVVFKGDGGKKEAERPVVDFFEALERRDTKMLIGTMEPDFAKQVKKTLGKDYIEIMEEYIFAGFPDDLELDIRRMETVMRGEDRAQVKVVDGTMTYTDEYGDKVSEEAADADMDVFEVVRVDGKWYISEETLIELGFDYSDLEDVDLEDLESDLPYDDGSLVELPVDSDYEALMLVFEQPENLEWYMNASHPQYLATDENTSWVVYLYEEAPDGTEIPFGHFAVDKETGEVWMVASQ